MPLKWHKKVTTLKLLLFFNKSKISVSWLKGLSRARKVAMKGLMLWVFLTKIFQHFLQVTREFRLCVGRAEQCQVRSQPAWVWVRASPAHPGSHFLISASAASAAHWRHKCSGSLSGRAQIQPRQLGKRWAGSSGGLCSWAGWVWRRLSAGHELAAHQPQAAAHLLCSQGSSWYFPAVCVVGNSSHIFTFFSSRRLITNTWDGSAGMVARALQSLPDHANGCFNGITGKEVQRWCCPGFLAGERENNLLKSHFKFMAKNSKDLRKPWCPSGSHPTFPPHAFYSLWHRALLLRCSGFYRTCLEQPWAAAVLVWPLLITAGAWWLPLQPAQGSVPTQGDGDGAVVGNPPVPGPVLWEALGFWRSGSFLLFFSPLKEFSVIQWNPVCRWNFWALGLWCACTWKFGRWLGNRHGQVSAHSSKLSFLKDKEQGQHSWTTAANSWMFPNKMPWVSLFFPLRPKFSALEKLLWQSADGNDDKINLWIVLGRFGKSW